MTISYKLMPRQPVPELSLDLAGGGSWSLAEENPENFVLLIFYRGLHCPICRKYLLDVQSRQYDLKRRGVRTIAASTDDQSRANEAKKRWGLDRLDIAYGLSLAQAQEWGLYISASRGPTTTGLEEPSKFNEPGLYLINPDKTLYYASVQSAPFARSSLAEVLQAIDYVLGNDYPARGEAVPD